MTLKHLSEVTFILTPILKNAALTTSKYKRTVKSKRAIKSKRARSKRTRSKRTRSKRMFLS